MTGEGALYTAGAPVSAVPAYRTGTRWESELPLLRYRRVSRFGDLCSRGLVEGSIAFTRPVSPLTRPPPLGWERSWALLTRFRPRRYRRRLG